MKRRCRCMRQSHLLEAAFGVRPPFRKTPPWKFQLLPNASNVTACQSRHPVQPMTMPWAMMAINEPARRCQPYRFSRSGAGPRLDGTNRYLPALAPGIFPSVLSRPQRPLVPSAADPGAWVWSRTVGKSCPRELPRFTIFRAGFLCGHARLGARAARPACGEGQIRRTRFPQAGVERGARKIRCLAYAPGCA